MKITEYVPGTPCWVDLGSPDVDQSCAFYTALFGWTAHGIPDPAAGGYTMFHLDDAPVAAVGPVFNQGQPAAWAWYAAVDDLDETARRVESAGGKVLMAPMEVMDSGRMATFFDASGTPFSGWEKRDFYGAQVVNEPNSFVWNELMTRDPEGATSFYHAALDWSAKPSEMEGADYTEFQVRGRSVAGMMPMIGDMWPADLPDHWMIYFSVHDCEAACAKIEKLGGTVSVPPTDTPVGRFAVVSDPTGAFFAVIKMNG
jgi:hypothetical protein